MFEPHVPSVVDTNAPFSSERPLPRVTRPMQRTNSTQLLAGSRELVIEHAGQEYHLRLTRNDKLILTK